MRPGVTVWSQYLENLNQASCVESVSNALDQGLNGYPYDLVVLASIQHVACVLGLVASDRWPSLHAVSLLAFPSVSDRFSSSFVPSHEMRFLHGMLCAQATQTGIVGWITSSVSLNGVSRPMAAFYLGVKYMNPAVRVVAGLTGAFMDPVAEAKAAKVLMHDSHADCIGVQQNDLKVHEVARQYNVYTAGYATDARYFSGELVLSSALFNWTYAALPFYEQVANASWIPRLQNPDTQSSYLSAYSTCVEQAWRDPIDAMNVLLHNEAYNMFCTPNFTDPLYMKPNHTYEASPGIMCLNPMDVYTFFGPITGVDIVVEYNATNPAYDILYVKWTDSLAFVLLALTVLIVALCVFSIVDILIHRHHPAITAASPLFLILILVGMLLTCASPFFKVGRPTSFNCMAPWWSTGVGYSIIMACLIAKNWRIYKIFSSGRFKSIAIFNFELLAKWVSIIVGLEVLLLAVWTGYSPLKPSIMPTEVPETRQMICALNMRVAGIAGGSGVIAYIIYNLGLTIPAALISYWTRGAKALYKESSSIALIVYATLLITCISVGVSYAVPSNYAFQFVARGYAPWLSNAITWFVLFVPKHMRVHSKPPTLGTSTNAKLSTDRSARRGFESVPNHMNSVTGGAGARGGERTRSGEQPYSSRVRSLLEGGQYTASEEDEEEENHDREHGENSSETTSTIVPPSYESAEEVSDISTSTSTS